MSNAVQLTIIRSELPGFVRHAGENASMRFLECFTVNIRNPNTRAAYGRAAGSFFHWCEDHGIAELKQLQPVRVAAYVEQLGRERSAGALGNIWPDCACSLFGS